jgi:glutathione S-transferase
MFDWFDSPTSEIAAVDRSAEAQAGVDAATAGLALYHYPSCMYCARVRRAIERLRLNIELRDVMHDPARRRELIEGGGRATVPCLRVDGADGTRWMYESADIVRYLVERFGAGAPVPPAA